MKSQSNGGSFTTLLIAAIAFCISSNPASSLPDQSNPGVQSLKDEAIGENLNSSTSSTAAPTLSWTTDGTGNGPDWNSTEMSTNSIQSMNSTSSTTTMNVTSTKQSTEPPTEPPTEPSTQEIMMLCVTEADKNHCGHVLAELGCLKNHQGDIKCICEHGWKGPQCGNKIPAELILPAAWALSAVTSVLALIVLGVAIYLIIRFRRCQKQSINISRPTSCASCDNRPGSTTTNAARSTYAEYRYSAALHRSVQSPVNGPNGVQSPNGECKIFLGMASEATTDFHGTASEATTDFHGTASEAHTADLKEKESLSQNTVQKKRESRV